MEMKRVRIDVRTVRGRSANGDGDFFNEFEALDLAWKQEGYAYCWLNKDPRNIQTAKRRGWVICDAERDFLGEGCPQEYLPGERTPDGTLTFGDVILGKMPLSLYSKRALAKVERAKARRRGEIERVLQDGERVADALRSKGQNVGRNILSTRANV